MSPTFTSCPTLTGTDCTLRESALLTSYVSAASILPSPRTWVVMVPGCTLWPVTSGRERFIIVFEKKVSTSMTARKMMATFLTQPLFLTFSLMAFPPSECVCPQPLTEPWVAMPSTRYSSPCRKSSSVGTMYMVAMAKASPTSPEFIVER